MRNAFCWKWNKVIYISQRNKNMTQMYSVYPKQSNQKQPSRIYTEHLEAPGIQCNVDQSHQRPHHCQGNLGHESHQGHQHDCTRAFVSFSVSFLGCIALQLLGLCELLSGKAFMGQLNLPSTHLIKYSAWCPFRCHSGLSSGWSYSWSCSNGRCWCRSWPSLLLLW